MKGLILAGGTGSRLRPITHTGAKQLVPVANRPILFHGLAHMADAGIREVGIVVGRQRPDGTREALGRLLITTSRFRTLARLAADNVNRLVGPRRRHGNTEPCRAIPSHCLPQDDVPSLHPSGA